MQMRKYRPALVSPAALLALCLLNPSAVATAADTPQPLPPARPLQTELLGPLDLSHAKEGALILVRVDLDWSAGGCTLRAGSVVQGHIVHFDRRSKTQKTSTIHVLFDAATCDGQPSAPYPLSLIALVGPVGGTSQTGQSGVSEAALLADAPGLAIGGGGSTLRSASQASNINTFTLLPARSLPPTIVPGQVVDIARTNLSVGTGVQGATVISGDRKDVRLEKSTSLILLPTASLSQSIGSGAGASPQKPAVARGSIPGTGGGLPTAPASVPVKAETGPADQTEICTAACTVASLTGSAANSSIDGVLSIHNLGYAPHDLTPRVEFNNETTLTWLDEHNLLCTFDPHQLRNRPNAREEDPRDIRAVLIDPATRTVKRVVQWHVRGSDHYLWQLSGGRVIVHIGKELRVFGPDLKQLATIPIDGPVAYVISSPSGDHIVIGIVKVLYSEAVYRQLQETLSEDPEEEVDLRILDRDLRPLASLKRSTKSAIPVLADNGELRVTKEANSRWKLSEFRWDRTEHLIQTVKSACRPALSTPKTTSSSPSVAPPPADDGIACSDPTVDRCSRANPPPTKSHNPPRARRQTFSLYAS